MTAIGNRTMRFLGVVALAAAGCFATGCTVEDPNATDESAAVDEEALSANQHTAYEFFVAKGLTKYQAAAIVGNLIQESSVNPHSIQYGGGPGRGIAQWSVGGRWNHDSGDNVAWYAAHHGQSEWSLSLQLNFIWYELTHFSGYGLSELKASHTLTQAVVAFQQRFEGCGTCDESKRIQYAQQVLNAYGH